MSGGINGVEQKICDWFYPFIQEGAKARREHTSCPYPPYTLKSFMHLQGWCKEDLRIALCKADPAYRKDQLAHDPELEKYL